MKIKIQDMMAGETMIASLMNNPAVPQHAKLILVEKFEEIYDKISKFKRFELDCRKKHGILPKESGKSNTPEVAKKFVEEIMNYEDCIEFPNLQWDEQEILEAKGLSASELKTLFTLFGDE